MQIIFKDEAEKVKSEFIAVVSHRMRTPLCAIQWYAESLLDGDCGRLKDKQKRFIKHIFLNGRRLIDILDNLFRVAVVEKGKVRLCRQKVNLADLIDEVLGKLRVEIARKNLTILYGKKSAMVWADTEKIKRVLLTLLDNAVKYNFARGKIGIDVEKQKDGLICSISDTGIGIPLDQQKRIFTRFFRANNAISMNTEGNGLSLYLAKAYVESHGGKIWVESRPGKGCTFFFTLPFQK